MKTLALSDFHWDRDSRDIKLSDTLTMTPSDFLNHDNFSKVKFYFNIVTKNQPDLLLLCGDVTGDGSCGHGHTSSLTAFLKLVESKKIQTRYISGNHDEPQFYDEIKRLFANSKYVKELTNKPEKIGGIKVIGLSWEQTRTKTSFRQLFTPEKVDIVVCHCDHGQRLNLFNFNTDFIISGHFDRKVINPKKKTFISLDNDAPAGTNYLTIDINQRKKEITFYVSKFHSSDWTYFKFIKTENSFALADSNDKNDNRFFSFSNLCDIYSLPFQKAIETVLDKKYSGQKISDNELTELTKVKGISKTFVNSFTPTA